MNYPPPPPLPTYAPPPLPVPVLAPASLLPPPPQAARALPPPMPATRTGLLVPVPHQPMQPPVLVNPPAKRINVRNKGKRGEREVIDILQEVINETRTRFHLAPLLLQRNTLQAHVGGTDLHGLPGFAVEVKFQETPCVPQWWAQATRQAERHGGVPVLFYRASKQRWTVMFRAYVQTPKDRDLVEIDITTNLEDFLMWFREAYDESCVDEMHTLG